MTSDLRAWAWAILRFISSRSDSDSDSVAESNSASGTPPAPLLAAFFTGYWQLEGVMLELVTVLLEEEVAFNSAPVVDKLRFRLCEGGILSGLTSENSELLYLQLDQVPRDGSQQ